MNCFTVRLTNYPNGGRKLELCLQSDPETAPQPFVGHGFRLKEGIDEFNAGVIAVCEIIGRNIPEIALVCEVDGQRATGIS